MDSQLIVLIARRKPDFGVGHPNPLVTWDVVGDSEAGSVSSISLLRSAVTAFPASLSTSPHGYGSSKATL